MEFTFKNKFLFISLIVFTSCTNLIYYPDKYLWNDPQKLELSIKEFVVPSFDGTKLYAWDLKSLASADKFVVMYHGNAQNMTAHFVNLYWMIKDYKTDVLIFDYRGFGKSEGMPYPRGVAEDGLKFLQVAYDKFKLGRYKKFIVYAQSLGGAVVMRALEEFEHRDEIDLLVLDSTFISPQDVAHFKIPYLGYMLIPGDYTANKKLTHLTMPVLVIHSKKDPVVNFKFGEEIFHLLPSTKKEFWILDEGQHGDVFFLNKSYHEKFIKLIN